MKSLLFVILVGSVAGERPLSRCKLLFKNAGMSTNFNETIAHALHSMTVEGLQLFDPLQTADNNIPTIDRDITSKDKILHKAPSVPIEHEFTTDAMNILNHVLSNLGRNNDGMDPDWTPIERVAHEFHMWEMWKKVANNEWKTVQFIKPEDEICKCLTDRTMNGIEKALIEFTKYIHHYPKLTDAKSWKKWKAWGIRHSDTQMARQDIAIYLRCTLN